MTGAPASVHQAARRRVELLVEREYRPDPARCIAAIVKLLTYQAPAHRTATTDTADDRRPLGAGARPSIMHDALASRPKDDEGAAGDDRHAHTSTAN